MVDIIDYEYGDAVCEEVSFQDGNDKLLRVEVVVHIAVAEEVDIFGADRADCIDIGVVAYGVGILDDIENGFGVLRNDEKVGVCESGVGSHLRDEVDHFLGGLEFSAFALGEPVVVGIDDIEIGTVKALIDDLIEPACVGIVVDDGLPIGVPVANFAAFRPIRIDRAEPIRCKDGV